MLITPVICKAASRDAKRVNKSGDFFLLFLLNKTVLRIFQCRAMGGRGDLD